MPALAYAFALCCFLPQGNQAQAKPEPNPLEELGIEPEVAALFAKVEPEFLRYSKITFYGTTLASTQPPADRVDAAALC